MEMDNKTIVCSGTSMFPFLQSGDFIRVRKTRWNRLCIGDLVVVESRNSKHPIVHRLVGWERFKNERFGVLKGDSLPHTDSFLLEQHNYLGRVWALERNGKIIQLKSFREKIKARLMALLSVRNLTPGILRAKVKIGFERWGQKIPGIGSIGRFFLKKARCFIFSGKENTKRLRMVYNRRIVGEVVFQAEPQSIISSRVFSLFSVFISSQNLIAHSANKFPQLFKQQPAAGVEQRRHFTGR